MEIIKSAYTDLIFHIFAHMKVDNASDLYDEAYVVSVEKELGRKTVIPEYVVDYYCANFERLAFINFLPYFMVKNMDELCYMISHAGMTTDEDYTSFIDPFCNVIRDIAMDYIKYRNRKETEQAPAFEELQNYISKQSLVMERFFDRLSDHTKMNLKVVISDGMRKNGRAAGIGDCFVVTLPAPSENYSVKEIFMQLVHECTHTFTDQLLDSINMEDGSHDIAEYQVMLFDLWLLQRDCCELCDDYIKWLSQDVLDECNEKLSDVQKTILKECLESF